MRRRGWNRTEEQGSSLWKDAFLRLSRNRAAMFSLLALALIAAACFLGPLLPWLPHPNVQDLSRIAESPSWGHWFGTDQLGRDLLARVLYGGRISLLVGVVATGVSLVIGVAYGLVSGYAGGRLDALMMRLVDVLFALPFIVLVIIFSLSVEEPARRLTQWVSGMTGWSVEMVSPMTGLIPLFIAIGALGWLTLARIVRTQTMELKGQEFVEAARSLGIGHMKILFRHIAPNLFGTVIVYTTLAVPGIMLLEAVLSFLGLGVKAPNASWGTLIKEGADRMEVSPELLLFPALLFSATLLALNFLGDGLRDALDPKSMLVVSNVFMTWAWYGHLKKGSGADDKPLLMIILMSWGLAFFEYCFMIPANRLGSAGGLNVAQLKIMQEVITLCVFIPFALFYIGEKWKWDYLWAFLCVLGAVFFVNRERLLG